MPTRLKAIYVSRNGVGQLTEEGTDDTVYRLCASSVSPKQFFDDLSRVSLSQQPRRGAKAPDGGLVTEYTPPSVLVEVGDREGRIRQWLGDRKDMSGELAAITKRAGDLVKSGSGLAIDAGSRYIRATVLTAQATNDMREAGVLREACAHDLEKAPLVRTAISHPRMLVALEGTSDPYCGLGAFSHGRSVALSIDKRAFQVRNLVKANTSERKGNTE